MYIFAIIKKNKIVATFLEKNYENAKLYFQGYIYQDDKYFDYKLYKIAEINNELKITSMKVFITGGYETNNKQEWDKRKIEQQKLNIEKAKKEEEQIKQIEKLFNGRII